MLGCLLASAPRNADDSQSDSAAAASPFKGGLIVIGSKGCRESRVILENVTVRHLGDRPFLVGTAPVLGDRENRWIEGSVVWFAIDDVSAIAEYSDLNEYKKTNSHQL